MSKLLINHVLCAPLMPGVRLPTWGERIMQSLLKFFSITYIVSWTFFAAAATISGWSASPPSGLAVLSVPLFLLGTIAPSLVALALTERADGRAGTLALLRRIVQWPAGARSVRLCELKEEMKKLKKQKCKKADAQGGNGLVSTVE